MQCQLQLWTGALLGTTMALKLITLALTALVLVQVGHGSCSHSNLQYSVRETSGLTTSQDAPCVWCVGVVTGDSECRRVDNGDAGSRQFR